MALEEFSKADNRYGHPTEVIAVKSCFVDPDGKFYALPYAGHDDFAHAFHGVWASDLECKGWLHISGGSIYTYNLPTRDIPQRQIDTLFYIMFAYQQAGEEYVAERFHTEFAELIRKANGDNYGLGEE